MAESDWTFMNDILDATSLRRGVTTGATPPNGGGNFVFGFNSTTASAGACALYTAQANFAPMPKGGSISAAVKRGASGGPLNFAPSLFLCGQGNSVNNSAYMLGLEDDDPHRIALVKGSLVGGVPSTTVGTLGVLGYGTETFLNNTWLHLRLDAIVNANGDVILQAFRNDLTANTVTAPVWVPVPGLTNYVDDALGVNSGSTPFSGGGYAGFCFQTKDVTRRGYFDQVAIARQL